MKPIRDLNLNKIIKIFQQSFQIFSQSYNIIGVPFQRMQQSYKSVADKFKRQLKVQDFVILSQENKQYRNLFKIMTEKQALLTHQVSQLEKKVQRLQNQKEEYKMKSNQYGAKISQYEVIREQLHRDYRALKKQIDQKVNKNTNKQRQFDTITLKLQSLSEQNIRLQQQINKKDLIIEQLNERLRQIQTEVMDKKIKIFTHLVDNKPIPMSRIKPISHDKFKKKKQISFIESSKTQSNTRSLGTSDINSISFSLIEGDSVVKSKVSKSGNNSFHNKSIYL